MLASPPVVGFDLDMTLVDSAAGIAATLAAALAELGVESPGPGLADGRVPAGGGTAGSCARRWTRRRDRRYRELYPQFGVAPVRCCPARPRRSRRCTATAAGCWWSPRRSSRRCAPCWPGSGWTPAPGAPDRDRRWAVRGRQGRPAASRARPTSTSGTTPATSRRRGSPGAACVAVATGPHSAAELDTLRAGRRARRPHRFPRLARWFRRWSSGTNRYLRHHEGRSCSR